MCFDIVLIVLVFTNIHRIIILQNFIFFDLKISVSSPVNHCFAFYITPQKSETRFQPVCGEDKSSWGYTIVLRYQKSETKFPAVIRVWFRRCSLGYQKKRNNIPTDPSNSKDMFHLTKKKRGYPPSLFPCFDSISSETCLQYFGRSFRQIIICFSVRSWRLL